MWLPERASILAVDIEKEDISALYGVNECQGDVHNHRAMLGNQPEVRESNEAIGGLAQVLHTLPWQYLVRHQQARVLRL